MVLKSNIWFVNYWKWNCVNFCIQQLSNSKRKVKHIQIILVLTVACIGPNIKFYIINLNLKWINISFSLYSFRAKAFIFEVGITISD